MPQHETQGLCLRTCLCDALLILMDEKPLADISITEICQRAGTSRMAYYRHYPSKEAILSDYLDRVFALYLDSLLAAEPLTLADIARGFFHFFGRRDAQFLHRLSRSGLTWILLDKFCEYMHVIFGRYADVLPRPIGPYEQSFAAGGLYKLLVDWVMAGAIESPEEMATLVVRLFDAR